jgi:predicted enzyme related to lactoylglutathione lyase
MGRVIHFELQADDLGRAKKFYESVLGWKIAAWEGGGPMEYYMVTTGPDGVPGINGGMYKRGETPLHTFDCTAQVDDIDAAIAAVKKNGGTIRKEKAEIPGVGWFAGAIDTEGNMFSIMQPTQWQPH